MAADAPPLDVRGHEIVLSSHLTVHGLRDWLLTLDDWAHGVRPPALN
jgi:hypothetical protein